MLEQLINDRRWVYSTLYRSTSGLRLYRTRTEMHTSSSYQRLLVHRCAAYYKVTPETDTASKNAIALVLTIDSRVPPRKIAVLVPQEATPAPAFKIMPRNKATAGRTPAQGSGADGPQKKPTLEEREAAYNEARTRIFHTFEE
ncbi:hypothetical protein PENSPDRAFT_572932, partial [Peniophora sp. CONT]